MIVPPSPVPPLPPAPGHILDLFDRITHPAPTAFGWVFHWVSIGLVVILLAVPLGFASPLMPADWACSTAAWLIEPVGTKELFEHLCDWLVLLTQTAIFIFIGGIAFTEAFARRVAGLATRLQQYSIDAGQQANEHNRERLIEACRQLTTIGHSNLSRLAKIQAAFDAINTVYEDAGNISNRYIWFGIRGMVVNFPGGLYGFLGFICLLAQVWAMSAKTLIDYLPASCTL